MRRGLTPEREYDECGGAITVHAVLAVGKLTHKKSNGLNGKSHVVKSSNMTMKNHKTGKVIKLEGGNVTFKAEPGSLRFEYRYAISWDYCNSPATPGVAPDDNRPPEGRPLPGATTRRERGQRKPGRRTVGGPPPWRPLRRR